MIFKCKFHDELPVYNLLDVNKHRPQIDFHCLKSSTSQIEYFYALQFTWVMKNISGNMSKGL